MSLKLTPEEQAEVDRRRNEEEEITTPSEPAKKTPRDLVDEAHARQLTARGPVALNSQLQAELEAGYGKGRELFRNDPEMQAMVSRRRELLAGRLPEIQGQRAGYLRQLQSQAARTGAGGIRQAAMRNAADIAGQRAVTQAAAGGAKDLDKLLMQQRFGELSTGLGYGQLGASERGANAMASASRGGSPGFLGGLLEAIF